YRFLVAKKEGYPFTQFQEAGFKEAWNSSVKQTEAMLDSIVDLPPHHLSDTVSLNNSRKIIILMAEPIIKLEQLLGKNIDRTNEFQSDVKTSNMEKTELAQNLRFEVFDIKLRELDYPVVVCASN